MIFGRLTVVGYAGSDDNGKSKWLCQCECGGQKVVYRSSLIHGITKSCGCLQREQRKDWTDAGIKADKKSTLCVSCIRSAAPPELQCIWDASRATILPEGAKSQVITVSKETGLKRIRVISCPEYLSVYDDNNKKRLQEARVNARLG